MIKVFDQTDLQSPSFFRRIAALVYDLMIVIAVMFAVLAVGVALNDGEPVSGPIYQSALLVSVFVFNAYAWTKSGQTIGMMAWRLRVQTLEGYSLSWTQSLVRFFAAGLSIACLGLGYFWILFSDQRLSWHDQISQTRVVQLPPKKKEKT
jgi:uncharacterized RDD family membrane protein YckC